MAYYYAQPLNPTPPEPAPVRIAWLSEAFELFKPGAGPWIGALAVAGVIGMLIEVGWYVAVGLPLFMRIASMATSGTTPSGTTPSMTFIYHDPTYMTLVFGAVVLSTILQALFSGGFMIMANKCLRGQTPAVSDLFGGMRFFLGMLVVVVIISIPNFIQAVVNMAILGAATSASSGSRLFDGWAVTLLSYLLNTILCALLLPAMALIVDGRPVGESINTSVRQMSPVFWPALGISVLFWFIFTLSLLPCLLGTMITVPMLYLLCSIAARERCGLSVTGVAPPPKTEPYVPGVWPPPPSQPGAPTFADWRTTTPPNVWPPPVQGAPPADVNEPLSREPDPPPGAD